MDGGQAAKVSITKDSASSNIVHDLIEKNRNSIKQQPKMTLGQDSKPDVSLDTEIRDPTEITFYGTNGQDSQI